MNRLYCKRINDSCRCNIIHIVTEKTRCILSALIETIVTLPKNMNKIK